MEKHRTKYAIIGAGNGGQSIAGYLGLLGYDVRLYDPVEETIEKLKALGGIKLTGETEGFGKITAATTKIEEAIDGSDVIMVVSPSIYHRDIAEKCAPYINPNQIVFLHPGATFGAFAFRKALKDFGCRIEIPIAESNTLIYACRAVETGLVHIGGRKDRILVATVPAEENERVCALLQEVYPEVQSAKNVLVTSLDNTNPLFHPAPTLFSTSWVESNQDFLYYYDGISESIGEFIMGMDTERINIGKALGLEYGADLISSIKQYELEYNVIGENISDIVRRVDAYNSIKGPSSLKTRYIYEDVPMGLVPLVAVGKLVNVSVERMELIIRLSELMLEQNFSESGRNLKNLGLEGLSPAEIRRLAED